MKQLWNPVTKIPGLPRSSDIKLMYSKKSLRPYSSVHLFFYTIMESGEPITDAIQIDLTWVKDEGVELVFIVP